MTGARSWYNRFRSEDAKVRGLKHSSTNVAAQKVKYQLLVAIHVAILESNIVVANNRLSHVKPPEPPRPVASRGDGTIMAPSLHYMFVSCCYVMSLIPGSCECPRNLTRRIHRKLGGATKDMAADEPSSGLLPSG